MQNHFELKNESNQFGGPASCYAIFFFVRCLLLSRYAFHTVSQFQQEQKIFYENLNAMVLLCVFRVCMWMCDLYVASLIPSAFLMNQWSRWTCSGMPLQLSDVFVVCLHKGTIYLPLFRCHKNTHTLDSFACLLARSLESSLYAYLKLYFETLQAH